MYLHSFRSFLTTKDHFFGHEVYQMYLILSYLKSASRRESIDMKLVWLREVSLFDQLVNILTSE